MSLRAERSSLPEVKGLFDGIAIRGPVTVGSVADIVLLAEAKSQIPCSLHRYSNRERIWQTARVRNRDVVLARRDRLEPIELPWPTRVGCAG